MRGRQRGFWLIAAPAAFEQENPPRARGPPIGGQAGRRDGRYILRTVAPPSHRGLLPLLRPVLRFAAFLAFATSACGAASGTLDPLHPAMMTPAPVAGAGTETPERPKVEREVATRLNARLDLSEPWKPISDGAFYLAPEDVVGKDGGVDVVVHFHGATMVDDEWRATGLDAVIVSVHLPGYGVAQYRDMFAQADRFGALVDDAVKRVGGTHVRRLGLVSYSAGYGAIQDVLADPTTYAMVDTVIVLDGMHVDYREGLPDDGGLAIFERFAKDAAFGDKQMILTHSAVAPLDYASTTETATMLLASVGVTRIEEKRTNVRGMTEWYHADHGGLHVRGFRGDNAKDHIDQVHLVGDAVRVFIAPRWTRLAVLEEGAHETIEM
jgi:hypothetical protein